MYLEPLITLAKEDSVAHRRLAFARLANKEAVKTLFETLGPRYKTRPGGYLRVMKAGFRAGDSAPVAYVQLLNDENSEPMSSKIIEGTVLEEAVESAE